MRARDVVGKRIVKVDQVRIHDPQLGHMVVALDALVLDDGSRIVFASHDRYYDEYVTADVIKPATNKEAQP